MVKNFIISGLLIYILSTMSGWAVEGFWKFVVCAILTLAIGFCITFLEELAREFFYENI